MAFHVSDLSTRLTIKAPDPTMEQLFRHNWTGTIDGSPIASQQVNAALRPACGRRDRRRQLTFEQLGDRASRFANGLRRLGLVPGDRVAVLLENQLEYPEIDVGLALGGFVRVALNARLAKDDHAYVLEDCDARAIVTDQAFDDVSSALTDGTDLKWLRIGAHQNGDVAALDYDHFWKPRVRLLRRRTVTSRMIQPGSPTRQARLADPRESCSATGRSSKQPST